MNFVNGVRAIPWKECLHVADPGFRTVPLEMMLDGGGIPCLRLEEKAKLPGGEAPLANW